MPMTSAEVIAAAHVPGTHSVFFLGCFDKRVTVFSQQVRALNLVAAILDQDMVREDGRVAIVGAGAAGITAAVAFARAAPSLKAIHVYEADKEVLHLQQTSGRYLHPHNYDWPAATAANDVAGLPILNWTAGAARDVQAHLVRQFDEAKKTSTIELFRDNVRVTLHTNEPHLFGSARRPSLTGLGCALVLETDEQSHRNLLTTIVGAEFEGPPPMTGPIRIQGRAAINPWKRFLRLGPDGDRNLAPFSALKDALPAAAKTQPPGCTAPATPEMIEAATAHFGHLVAPAVPPAPAAVGENEDLEVSHLRIDSAAPGLGVSGDLAPQEFGAAWRECRGVVVDCALRPQDAPRVATALARLCGHAVTSMLFGRERRRWEDFLRGAASPRTLPGNLDFAFRVTEARALPGVDGATAMSSDALADAIHRGGSSLSRLRHDVQAGCASRARVCATRRS